MYKRKVRILLFDLPLPASTRRTHWGLMKSARGHEMNEQSGARPRSVQDEIKRRVQGIVGGIRLLAHSDGNGPDSEG